MKWVATKFKGLRYREHPTRKHGVQLDRYFNVRFTVAGASVNEGYGWASEGMSASKAYLLMVELKEELRIGKGTGKLADRRKEKQAEQEAKHNKPTMTDLWKAYQDKLTKQKKKKAASTLSEENRRWNTVISPAMGAMKVEDVTPAILTDLLDTVADKAPVSANRLHSLLSIMFKPAIAKGWITIHPLQWIDKPGGSEPPRKRVLSDEEIKKIWPCFDRVKTNPGDILRLLLLTAQRPGEIMAMRWEDIDFDARTWTQATNKTGTVHIVPLSDQVLSILKAREGNGGEWVFPSRYNATRLGATGDGHTKNTKDARKKLKKFSGVEGWTAHDLRRTARTIMSRLRIKQHVRERVLNHSQKGVVEVYDQYDYLQEKADALDKLGREIDRIIGAGTKAKIVKLRAG